MKAFIHVKKNEGWNNFPHDLITLPCVGDAFSMSTTGPIYKVLGRMFMEFEAEYEVELYVDEVTQTDYTSNL